MTNVMTKAKTWVKPKVERLGELKDVRQGNTGNVSNSAMS